METALLAVVFLAVGIGAGYVGRRYLVGKKLGSVEEQVGQRLAEAETKSKEIVLDAKEKAAAFLADAKNEERERRKEFDALETRLVSREELLDKRSERSFARRERGPRAGRRACGPKRTVSRKEKAKRNIKSKRSRGFP